MVPGMRSHLISAAVMAATGAFLAIRYGMAYALFDEWPLVVAAIAYAGAAIWWIALECAATRRPWVHLIVVWAPAILPAWPLARATVASRTDDTAALGVLLHLGPAGFALLASAAGAFVIFNRILWPKPVTG